MKNFALFLIDPAIQNKIEGGFCKGAKLPRLELNAYTDALPIKQEISIIKEDIKKITVENDAPKNKGRKGKKNRRLGGECKW